MPIQHNTSIDFVRRIIPEPIHLVQGDKTLPQLAVELLQDGQPYSIPTGAAVNIRMGKPDGHGVYNPAKSVSDNVAVFEVTEQMCAAAGDATAQVDVVANGGVAATGTFPIIVDKSVIGSSTMSDSELSAFDKAIAAVATVNDSVEEAKKSEENAAKSATDAASYASQIEQAKKDAAASAEAAKTSETNAAASEANAKNSETAAASSAKAAAASEKGVADSATAAANSAKAAATSETNAKASADAAAKTLTDVGTAKEDAVSAIGGAKTEALKAVATDKDAAAKSAKDAAASATLSESYAHGGTGTRTGEDADNAYAYMKAAQAASLGTIDEEMSDSSHNAVENQAIKKYVDGHTPATATADKVGVVKPDGTTITIDTDGTIHGTPQNDLKLSIVDGKLCVTYEKEAS